MVKKTGVKTPADTPVYSQMQIRKRDGSLEPVDVNKIVRAVGRQAEGLEKVDAVRVASQTISTIHDGSTTEELDRSSIDTAVAFISEEPEYGKLAAKLYVEYMRKEVSNQDIASFSQSYTRASELGLVPRGTLEFVKANARKFNTAINTENNDRFDYFGLEGFVKLLLRGEDGKFIETPQYFFMRVAILASIQNCDVYDTELARVVVKVYRKLATSADPAKTDEWKLAGLPYGAAAATVVDDNVIEFRPLKAGMGQAVAERTVLRKKENGEWETWGDVAERVALGNASLVSTMVHPSHSEHLLLRKHIANGNTLMSGRHLQHGDANQPKRNMEVFTNCLGGSTRILTMEYGPIEIAAIVDRTVHVISADGVPRPALISQHGNQDLLEFTFRPKVGGTTKFRTSVSATANHRWFLRDGSITSDLKVGDVIRSAKPLLEADAVGIVHGLVFGDGTAHKRRSDSERPGFSQGRTYASIRVCKQDAVKGEIHAILDTAGYSFTTPPSAKGDRVYYVGKFEGSKELPFTRDPEYIAGFIKGWWLADRRKFMNSSLEISTSSEEAVDWLKEHAGYAGYAVKSHRVTVRKEGDVPYANGKDLHMVRLRQGCEWEVETIEPIGKKPVFCAEEPVTTGFVLANGLLTGNCSTSSTSFLLFYLLLNGSGVGRCYDDDMMLVNWDNAPNIRCVLDTSHPDFDWSNHESVRDARHKYGTGRNVRWVRVEDSREGWAKALEIWETMAFEKIHADKLLILDFTPVREKNRPIGGMQNRPSSGPVPMMKAFMSAAALKGAGLPRWMQAIYVDHYFAECVLVGGARRAARMSTKRWSDRNVIDFVRVKRPVEFTGLTVQEVIALRRTGKTFQSFLWSSNNSVTVDEEFWELVKNEDQSELGLHAQAVFTAVCEAAYGDGTGEPGFINSHRLIQNDEGWTDLNRGDFVGSEKYQVNEETQILLSQLAKRAKQKPFHTITNPCGEIALNVLGGFCVIADGVPFFCDTLDEAEEMTRTITRALIRVNTMDSVYNREVRRTNRIGVGLTGVHEFAWKFFQLGFRELIEDFDILMQVEGDDLDPAFIAEMKYPRALDFWRTLARFNRAIYEESVSYSKEIGVNVPHTMTTIKPAGTTSKLFGLTEGWHLPAMAYYLRWVQFRNDDPLIVQYKNNGYPTRELKQYTGTTIVGFPTAPTITELGMGDKMVIAKDATPEEQFRWLRLGEKFWINGTDPSIEYGNQISYTLKYEPAKVAVDEFKQMMLENQSEVRCCSVMPDEDCSSYEYLPEEPITRERYEEIQAGLVTDVFRKSEVHEEIGREHVGCDNGACPIDFNSGEK